MSAGQININIPPDSQAWLFKDDNDPRPDAGRLWSLGRFPPACKPGDDILFRFDGRAVAAATVDEVYKPGMFDGVCHHGGRYLRGHKVTWLNSSFIDLRRFQPSFQIDCNDHRGVDQGKFNNVSISVSDCGDEIELDGGEMRVTLARANAVRLGRRLYRFSKSRPYVGNLHWDAYWVDLLAVTAVLNQMISADFRIHAGPTLIYEKADRGGPLHWRDLLSAALEAA